MRLRAADTDRPRGSDTTSNPIKYGDTTRLNGPPLIILWKARQATRPGQHPRRSGGRQHMSNSETRGSVIVGVCQQDPERWREFDSIYRPILSGFLRKQGLNESDAGDVVQDVFVKLLGKIQSYDRARYRVPDVAFHYRRTTRWSTMPGGGPLKGRRLDDLGRCGAALICLG